jgi:S1-C subfamily serine protease
VRSTLAPSEAEQVSFEGAGTGARVSTRVKSHDAGILRKRSTIQLKVQTPADTNTGDSGSALVDHDDCVIGFGFERTAPGDFPELTDWIWAANALDSLGLTPA